MPDKQQQRVTSIMTNYARATAMAYLDKVPDYEAIRALESEFPRWMVFRQGKGTWLKSCFARHRDNGEQVEGEDWQDLRDQIKAWIGRHAE